MYAFLTAAAAVAVISVGAWFGLSTLEDERRGAPRESVRLD